MSERVVRFGAGDSLVGILTDPPDCRVGRVGAVLVNAGIIHRVGPNRLYVRIARDLAARGWPALRFDFSGMGDSPAGSDPSPLEQRVIDEVQAAMACLRDAQAVDRFLLLGMCSGADIAFQTAVRDPRVVGVTMINAQSYEVETREEVDTYLSNVNQVAYYMGTATRDARKWIRALTGRVDYRSLLKAAIGRVRGLVARARLRACARAVAGNVHQLLSRDVHLQAVYGERDPGLPYFRLVRGEMTGGVAPARTVRLDLVADTDHMFTSLRAQNRLLTILGEFMSSASQDQVASGDRDGAGRLPLA